MKIVYGRVTKSPRAFAIVSIIIGVILILIGGGIIAGKQIFKMNSIKTTGTVICYVESGNSGGNPMYSIRYSYIDNLGNEHINTSSVSTSSKEYKDGSHVIVFYKKNNPDKSVYESAVQNIIFAAFLAVGLVLLIIGLVLYYLHKDEDIVWSETGFHKI